MSRSDYQRGYNKAMMYYPREIGYWKQCADGGYYCSSCGMPLVNPRRANEYLFCPFCGANMQGKETAIQDALKVLTEATEKMADILKEVST